MRNTFKLTGMALLLAFGPVAGFQAFAQKGWNNDGKLESTEIVVEKNKVLELPEASRNYEKFRIDPPEKKTNKVTYRFNDYKLPDQDVALSVRVLTIKQEDLPKLYGNYVKAGFGNYTTPYLKGYFHNKRDDKASYGAHVSHVSSNGPVDHESGVSNSEIGVNGETYLGGFTLGARAMYGRDGYNFYGYNPKALDPNVSKLYEQSFNRIGAEAYLNNLLEPSAKMQYKLGGGIRNFSDDYESSEFDGFANLNLDYYLSQKSRINLFSDFSYISFKDVNTLPNGESKISRPYFRIRPSYEMDMDKLDVSIGAMLAYADDNVNGGDKLNFYPAVRVGYEAIENKLVVFGGLGGDLERVTVNNLTRENPWLSSSYNKPEGPSYRQPLDVRNTDKQIEVYGGVTGSLASNVQFTLRAAYQNLNNLYFFNHNSFDSTRFVLQYDSSAVSNINFYGEVVYNKGDKTRFGVKLDYNNYSVDKLEQPFYRPALKSSIFASHNLYDKILFNAELYYIGSSFGKIYRGLGETAIVESDNIVDLNLKVDYRISEKFSTFVMLNNVLGKKYERFVNYPTKGFQAIGGITYTF